jgi:glycosyltransferase involved in cell wall biosynthesis
VDTGIFRPRGKQFLDLPRPIWIYFGRLAVEKGVEDFLGLQLPGSKLVVGDGPATALLKQRFPQAHYAGYRYGDELARYVSCADVFVFPSRTDTFGLVLLEAMACGVPVAAYPVTGPCDVVLDGVTGAFERGPRSGRDACTDDERRRLPSPCTQVHMGRRHPAARRAPGRPRRRARGGGGQR